ncbi:MAG: hypothetical protein WC824_07835 [Bacteroidota bacterium]|jgi:hypothetical protein
MTGFEILEQFPQKDVTGYTAEFLNDDESTGVVIIRKPSGTPYAMMCLQDYEALRKYGENLRVE